MATFTNRAFLTYNNITTGSNIASGEILESLSVRKTATVGEYTPGDRLTYAVSINNAGPAAVTGITVTDNLGAYQNEDATFYPLTYVADSILLYVNGVLQTAPAVTYENTLTVSGISIPAGGNGILIYSADANAFAPAETGGTVTNTVTVTGGSITTPVTAEETVTAAEAPALTITKSISPSTVTENSRVTYSFVIQNYGNTPVVATDNAVVTDTFDPLLSDLTVIYEGTAWQEGTNYTYDTASGLFTTNAGEITVPAATFTRDPETGAIITDPGSVVLTVTGTI